MVVCCKWSGQTLHRAEAGCISVITASAVQLAASGSGNLANCIDVLGLLARWPAAQLFPVLDIFRLLVLSAGHARLFAADAGPLEASNAGLGGLLARGLGKDAPAASTLVALRLASNCCKHAPLRRWLVGQAGTLFDLLADVQPANKNVRAAMATLLLDHGVALCNGHAEDAGDGRIRALSLLFEVCLRLTLLPCICWAPLGSAKFSSQCCQHILAGEFG